MTKVKSTRRLLIGGIKKYFRRFSAQWLSGKLFSSLNYRNKSAKRTVGRRKKKWGRHASVPLGWWGRKAAKCAKLIFTSTLGVGFQRHFSHSARSETCPGMWTRHLMEAKFRGSERGLRFIKRVFVRSFNSIRCRRTWRDDHTLLLQLRSRLDYTSDLCVAIRGGFLSNSERLKINFSKIKSRVRARAGRASTRKRNKKVRKFVIQSSLAGWMHPIEAKNTTSVSRSVWFAILTSRISPDAVPASGRLVDPSSSPCWSAIGWSRGTLVPFPASV